MPTMLVRLVDSDTSIGVHSSVLVRLAGGDTDMRGCPVCDYISFALTYVEDVWLVDTELGEANASSAGGGSRARGNVGNDSGCRGGGIFLVRFLPFGFNLSVPWGFAE